MKLSINEYHQFIRAAPYYNKHKEEIRLGAAFCEMYSINDDADLFWADCDDDVKDIILTNYIE